MPYKPVDEDRVAASGRRFGFRISPYVTCDLLAVHGVRMRNQRLVAMVSVIVDAVTDEWSAGLVYCEREDLVNEPDEDDGA